MADSASLSPLPSSVIDNALGDDTTPETLEALLSHAESRKDSGNIEFHKGKVLVKHTAGKNYLSDACLLYAEGIDALTKADECLIRLQSQQEENSEEGSGSLSDLNPSSTQYPQRKTSSRDNGGLGALLASLSTRADTLRSSLYLNLAACSLVLHDWAPAMACCTYVIERCGEGITDAVAASKVPVQEEPASSGDRDNDQVAGLELESHTRSNREIAAKALYRRSAANAGSGDVLAAKEDLVRALRLKPGDALIFRELKKATKVVADADAKERLRK